MTETADEIPQTPPEKPEETGEKLFNLHRNKTPEITPEPKETEELPPEPVSVQVMEQTPEQVPEELSVQAPEQNPEVNPDEIEYGPLVTFHYFQTEKLPQGTYVESTYNPYPIETKSGETKPGETKPREFATLRYLPLHHCRSYPIYKSYELRIMRSWFLVPDDGGLESELGPCYEIVYDGRLVCLVSVNPGSPFPITDHLILYLCKREVARIENVPFEMLYKSSVVEIPPWFRWVPARNMEIAMTPLAMERAKYSLTETGYAERFAAECRGFLVYDTPNKTWYAWDENHWEPANERLGQSKRFVADSLYTEKEEWKKVLEKEIAFASATGNNLQLKELNGFLAAYESHVFKIHQDRELNSMERIAASYMLCVDLEKEATHSILSFRNGGIDCATGRLLSHQDLARWRDKYPVHYIDRDYLPRISPVRFEEHLKAVFLDNTTEGLSDAERERRAEVLKSYFKRLLGYALTPGNARNLFVFLWGTGANGKSTTIDAIRAAIPSEIAVVPSKELLTTQEEKPTPGLFKGLLKRIMYFAEISDSKNSRGPKVSSESIKILSGEKEVNARTLYKDSADRPNLCLPIAATNELPSFDKEPDKALLRRIITIPFMHEFSGSTKRLDIGEILAKEADAIFSMMIRELQDYLAAEKEKPGSGLPELPDFCRNMQAELLSGSSYNAYVQEKIEPPKEGTDAKVYLDDIKLDYISWCTIKGIPVETKQWKDTVIDKDTGEYKVRHELTKGETAKLNTALKVNGYKSGTSSGRRYYRCRFKHE